MTDRARFEEWFIQAARQHLTGASDQDARAMLSHKNASQYSFVITELCWLAYQVALIHRTQDDERARSNSQD